MRKCVRNQLLRKVGQNYLEKFGSTFLKGGNKISKVLAQPFSKGCYISIKSINLNNDLFVKLL